MAFAADKTMDIVTGSPQITTATIQDAYVVGKQTRVSRHTFQSPTLIVEFSDGTKPVSITAHNGVEAGWLVNYINFGGADLKITDTVPAQDGSKKADPTSIDNFKIVVNGDSSTLRLLFRINSVMPPMTEAIPPTEISASTTAPPISPKVCTAN